MEPMIAFLSKYANTVKCVQGAPHSWSVRERDGKKKRVCGERVVMERGGARKAGIIIPYAHDTRWIG